MFTKVGWNSLNVCDDVNYAVHNFYVHLCYIFNETIHIKTFNRKFPFWYSTETTKLIKCKSKARKFALNSADLSISEEFEHLRFRSKSSIRKDYTFYLEITQKNFITDQEIQVLF